MKKYLLIIVFAVFIGLNGIFLAIGPKSNYSENEKRYLAAPPSYSFESLADGTFFSEGETFLSDRMPLRDVYVGINSYLNLALGKNSVSEVYYAKDGYLINAPDKTDNTTFSSNIKKMEEFSKATNIKSRLVLVPRCGYIMEEKLPYLAESYNDEELFEIVRENTHFVEFEDVSPVLSNGEREVYYKTDHHLTSYGNYLIYRSLSSSEETEYKIEVFDDFYGSTRASSGYWLTRGDKIELWTDGNSYTTTIFDGTNEKSYNTMFFKEHLEENDKYPVFLNGNQPLVTITNNSGGEGSLLIIRDSFAQGLAPFMARDYKNIYLADMRYYRKPVSQLIKDKNIDEIIYVFGISTLLTDSNLNWLM